MAIPPIIGIDFGGPGPRAPLLILGPSLGTSASGLWRSAAERITQHVNVIAWELPGHGRSKHAANEPFSIAELAAGVLALVDQSAPDAAFHYAGDSVGGCVGLQLLLDQPHRVQTATLLCTAAKIGTAQGWRDRAAAVRASGIGDLVSSAAQRWFAAGFAERQPEAASALLRDLKEADAEAYAQTCGALADFDVTDRLSEITAPVLTIAGGQDEVTPPELLGHIASEVKQGLAIVLEGVAHLAPAEAPRDVAALICEHLGRIDYGLDQAGLSVRREVLGDAHVDRAIAGTTDFTADFQRLITRYAWGSIWDRPGLDRRSRSLITLTALVARGHHEELIMHVRAARRNGVTDDEIKELLLQTAIYCGVPDANTAFRIVSPVLAAMDLEGAGDG